MISSKANGNGYIQAFARLMVSRASQIISIVLLAFFIFFFLIPLGYFLILSFFTFIQTGQYTAAFTLGNYVRMVSDVFYFNTLLTTFKMGAYVSAACFILGYPIAYFLGRSQSKWRNFMLAVVVASLFTNLVVRTYGFILLLAQKGVINNFLTGLGIVEKPLNLIFNMTGVVIGETQVELPVFILVVAGVIQMIDPELKYAANVMGADDVQSFFAVIWPLSLRGVIGGLSLVFALAISAYITPHLLSGGRIIFTSMLINTLVTKTLNYPMAGAISAVLVLSSLTIIGVFSYIGKKVS